DDGAHLPRAEIQDAPALRVPHETALRPLGDDRHEIAAVADEMRAGLVPERRVGIARRTAGEIVHIVLLGPALVLEAIRVRTARRDCRPSAAAALQPTAPLML